MARSLSTGFRRTPRDFERALDHVREAQALKRKYGVILEDVKRTFLGLSDDKLTEIFAEYGARYGASSRAYAEATIQRWRSGGVIMSGQTMVRLLDLVPKHLTTDEKLALIEKVRSETLRQLRRSEIRIQLRAGDSVLSSLSGVMELIGRQTSVELPRSFYEIKGWIHTADAEAMQAMVLAMEEEELYARTADLFYQVVLLQKARTALPNAKLIQITFNLPTARVIVSVGRLSRREQKRMISSPDPDNDLLSQLQKIENEQRFQRGEMGFHEYLLKNIDSLFTPEQIAELRSLAVKQGLELDRLKSEILIKGQTSGHDIKAFVDLVEDLKKKKTKADLSGKYTTPSGEIEIKAKTSRFGCSILPLGVVAIALAVGLLR